MEFGMTKILALAGGAKKAMETYKKGADFEELRRNLIEVIDSMERANAEAIDEIAKLNKKLDLAQTAHQKAKLELDALKELHREEIRIWDGIQFNKGKRTMEMWAAFCPKCSMPAIEAPNVGLVICSDENCKWGVKLTDPLRELARNLS